MPTVDEIRLFNPSKDRIETRYIRKLRGDIAPKVNLQLVPKDGLDENDKVRTPILRMIMDGRHELDPRRDCIKGDRAACSIYDQMVRESRRVSDPEAKRLITTPEMRFLKGTDAFCLWCIRFEHKRRRKANRLLRRFVRWIGRRQ